MRKRSIPEMVLKYIKSPSLASTGLERWILWDEVFLLVEIGGNLAINGDVWVPC